MLKPVFICALLLAFIATAVATQSRDLISAEKKFDHIESNGRTRHPNQSPTFVSQQEINAYLASDNIELPAGVQPPELEGQDGVVTGKTKVDFDKVREGTHSSNPLLSMFSGIHEVIVIVHAHGEDGQGHVHVDSVALDGIEVPRFVLQMFVEKFIQPKNPQIALDSQFALPDRIDSATVGKHQIAIIQK